jgi:chromosome segregation ATPase
MIGGDKNYDKIEAEYDEKINKIQKDMSKAKIGIMRIKDAHENLKKKLDSDKKEMEFFKKEYEKLPPKDKRKSQNKQVVEEAPKTEAEIIAKFKRDLRVYKYTLDLTRKEWKKNQTLALEKMNAHRKVIAKYKDDKIMLLNIVSDLESKLNEANRRLREGQEQQKQANAILGYDFANSKLASDDVPTPQNLHDVKSLDNKQTDALKNFMKSN